ncbi:MAG: RNA polymerase sigma factor [Thermoleophilia bacterium]
MREPTDKDLVEAILRGSRDAADVLFARHWSSMWRAAYAILGRREDADDVAQRAVERAMRSLDSFHLDGSFRAWSRRIAVNQALDLVRRTRPSSPVPEQLAAPDVYGEVLERHALAAAVARLEEDRRLVIVMRFWLDLTPSEIAEDLGIPPGTVSSRLSRALEDLRDLMEVSER